MLNQGFDLSNHPIDITMISHSLVMAGAGGEGRYSCTPGEQKCISVLEAEVTVVSLLQAFLGRSNFTRVSRCTTSPRQL